MWPGFDSELVSYVAKFVVGSFSAQRGFPQGAPVFPNSSTSKFQFDPECSNA